MVLWSNDPLSSSLFFSSSPAQQIQLVCDIYFFLAIIFRRPSLTRLTANTINLERFKAKSERYSTLTYLCLFNSKLNISAYLLSHCDLGVALNKD